MIRTNFSVEYKVNELLKERGMMQKELAELTGISSVTINDICNNNRSVANFKYLEKIAKALNITDIRDIINFKIL